MSKIWVNGTEIDLAKLTPEEISALCNSDNFDYIKPTGMFYSDSISGDGSFDSPFGVSKLDNPLKITILDNDGNVKTVVYDASQTTEVSLDDYRSVADQNTIDGKGTVASPFKVSDNLLKSIDSAYTIAVEAGILTDGFQKQIDDLMDFDAEVSAKCDSAIMIANSAVTISLAAEEKAELAEMIASGAMQIAMSASADVDKLYDFISTLIYTIEYDDETNSLIITYVDGSTSNVVIDDITKLEEQTAALSGAVDELRKTEDEIEIQLGKVVKDVLYDASTSVITAVYVDDSTKSFALADLIAAKQGLNQCISSTTINSQNIKNLYQTVSQNTTNINNITNEIVNINGDIDDIYSRISSQTEDINDIVDVIDEINAGIQKHVPTAVKVINYYNTYESGDVISYTNISGETFNVQLSGISNAISAINDQLQECVIDVDWNPNTRNLTVEFNNGTSKQFYISTSEEANPTVVTFQLASAGATEDISINGETIRLVSDAENNPCSAAVTGQSVCIQLTPDSKITDVNVNGQIIDSDSILSGDASLKAISNAIFPSNCTNLFANDSNLSVVDANSDLLINGENMFKDCSAMTSFNGNLKTLIIAPYMFYDCSSLVDFSTDMPMLREGNYMFYNCESFTGVNNLNLKRLEEGVAMFADCDTLKELDGISLDRLSNGDRMFSGSSGFISNSVACPKVVTGDYMFYNNAFSIYNGTLASLESAQYMFANNPNLSSVSVKDMNKLVLGNGMFSGCSNLSDFDVDYGFASLAEANGMFSNCSNIDNVSTKWSLGNLQVANDMFLNCTSLESFDVDMESLREGKNMFNGCSSMTGLTADVSSLTVADDMFKGCTALRHLTLKNLGCSLDVSETSITAAQLKKIANNAQDFSDTSKAGKVVITATAEMLGTAEDIFTNKGWSVVKV